MNSNGLRFANPVLSLDPIHYFTPVSSICEMTLESSIRPQSLRSWFFNIPSTKHNTRTTRIC